MTLLPVVERELRVAARERNTYRVRFLAAFLTVLFCVFSLWAVRVFFGGSTIPPRELFLFLTWIMFGFVILAGFSLTCDCISQEKRDSTLGLLFLTDLRGYDVVLGKLAAAAARGFYALLATVPVLALPLMMGGTNLTELARTTVTLVTSLFFSMAIGLLVSSLLKKNWSAFGVSGFVLFVFVALLPAYSEFVRSYYRDPIVAHWIEIPSPTHAMYMSFRNAIGLTTNSFPMSLACLFLLAATATVSAALITPHVWKDRPPARRLARFLQFLRSLKFGTNEFRIRFRRRLLDRNPLLWLSRREVVSSLGLLLTLFALGLAASWAGYNDWTFIGQEANEVVPVVAWFLCAGISHMLIALRLSIISAERFGEDRRSGALELILSTPISIKRILAGHFMGLRRYFAGAALFVFCAQAFALAYLYTVDSDRAGARNVGQAVREIIRHFQGDLVDSAIWEFHVFTIIILSLFPMLLLDWVAIAWLSTWRSLRVKHAIFAPLSALIILHFPPPFLFVFTAVNLNKYRMMPAHEFTQAVMLFGIAAGYFIANQLLWIWWSRRQIYKHFRAAATDRYQPAPRRRWWQFRVA
jgi:ABC-type transport system involved in multi-copper enzyme maturation permease subunit